MMTLPVTRRRLALLGGVAVFSSKPPMIGMPCRLTLQSGGTRISMPPKTANTFSSASPLMEQSRRSSSQPPITTVISPPRKSGVVTRRVKPPITAVTLMTVSSAASCIIGRAARNDGDGGDDGTSPPRRGAEHHRQADHDQHHRPQGVPANVEQPQFAHRHQRADQYQAAADDGAAGMPRLQYLQHAEEDKSHRPEVDGVADVEPAKVIEQEQQAEADHAKADRNLCGRAVFALSHVSSPAAGGIVFPAPAAARCGCPT